MIAAQNFRYCLLPLLVLLLAGCDQMGTDSQKQGQAETAAPVADEQSTGSQTDSKNTAPSNSTTGNDKQANSGRDNATGWTDPEASAEPDTACSNCGTITAIDPIAKKGDSSGIGVVAGGVAGGIIGNQIGGGTGKKIATVAGAIGGALAGNEVEKYMKTDKYYAVTVDMANDGQQTLKIANGSDLSVGQQVVVDGNNIYLQKSQ